MPVTYATHPSGDAAIKRPYFAGHKSSYLEIIREDASEYGDDISEDELRKFARMDEIGGVKGGKKEGRPARSRSSPADLDQMAAAKEKEALRSPSRDLKVTRSASGESDYLSVNGSLNGGDTPSENGFSRSSSSVNLMGNFDSFGQSDFPPVDRLTMFDILENLALPQRLEKMQNVVHNQAEKVRRQRAKLASRALSSKNNLVEEWRKRVHVAPEEQLDKYRKRMRESVDRLSRRWNDAKTVTLKEKISFVTAVLNIFISAYLIGAFPQYFHIWYTAQLMYPYIPQPHHHH